MKSVLLLGPPGAGKTTLAGAILKEGLLGGRVAFVFNDAGTPETVDAAILAGRADFRPMTGGCFGCRDADDLRRLIGRLREERYDWLLVEPYGFVDGHEVPAVLSGAGVDTRVLTLVDAHHHERNQRLLSQVVNSQLAAATLAVGLTKLPEGGVPELLAEEIARRAPGVYVGAVPEGRVPGWLAGRVRQWAEKSACGCGHDHHHGHHHEHHHHGHDHDHGHGDEHGFHIYSFRLRPEAKMRDVRGLATLDAVIRVKGVIDGQQFHAVHGDWRQGIEDPSPPFVTFYATAPIVESFYARYVCLPEAVHGDTQALLRSVEALTGEDADRAVREALELLPSEPLMAADGPETNPEMHELLNELRKRPGVSPELNAAAIRARVAYYLAVADMFTPASPWWSNEGSAKRKRDLAIGIAWFARNKPADVGGDLLERAKRAPLGRLLAEGLLGMRSHNSDPERALVIADETRETALFIRENGLESPDLLREGLLRAVTLAERDQPALAEAWSRALAAAS